MATKKKAPSKWFDRFSLACAMLLCATVIGFHAYVAMDSTNPMYFRILCMGFVLFGSVFIGGMAFEGGVVRYILTGKEPR